MKTTHSTTIILFALIALFLIACAPQNDTPAPVAVAEDQPTTPMTSEVAFTLKTIADNGKLLFVGVGGDIDGMINPDLLVPRGAVVRIVLINGDGMPHDLFIPDIDVKTEYVKKIGEQAEIVFEINTMQPGSYVYYCTLPGHRRAGQEGKLIVSDQEK